MNVYMNVIFILFSLLGLIGVIYIINLILVFTSFIDAKKQDITIKSNRLNSANLYEKCEATASILKILDIIIDLEIAQVIRTYTSLNTKYEINRIPDDINLISSNVYKAIKKDIYLNDDSVMTEEYLMSYITNIVTMNFIEQVRQMNNIIYEEK